MHIEEKDVYFHELDTSKIVDATVILDIDGTITCSSHTKIDEKVRQKIRCLEERNSVYVFSNNHNKERSRKIAHDLKLPYIASPHKKPNKKVLSFIEGYTCPVVVIGDKYLTDTLFAQFIDARHIRVRRYKCATDSFMDRIGCLFDDAVYAVAKLLHLVS